MKYRYTRLSTNQGINDPPEALTHQVTFEAVTESSTGMGPGMGIGNSFTVPMTEGEASKLERGGFYTLTLNKVN